MDKAPSVDARIFEDLVVLTLQHPEMKHMKIMRTSHQDSDEMVIEIKNFKPKKEGSE